MAIAQELVAKFKADTSDFTRKVQAVRKEVQAVGTQSQRMSREVEVSSSRATASMSKIGTAARATSVAIAAATVAVGAFSIKVGSDMQQAQKRIEAMLGSVEQSRIVIDSLRQAGYDTGASVQGLASSYGKLATFVDNGTLSLKESIEISKGMSVTALALGADTTQLSQVMYGLSQAMGSGTVRAEEFNQVTEPLPGIINRMEEAAGLASGELRQMINDGSVTSEMFKDLLIPALNSFTGEATKMTETLQAQQGILSNTFAAIGEDIYAYLEAPLVSATKALDGFLQQFVSVQRASGAELQRRLNENISQQAGLAGSLGGQGKGAQSRRRVFEALEEENNEIIAQLEQINAMAIEIKTGGSVSSATSVGSSKAKRKSSGRKPANRNVRKKSSKEKEEIPLFKEKITDMQAELGNFTMEASSDFDFLEAMFGDMQDSVVAGFITMSSSGKSSFKDMAQSMISDLQAIITKTLLMKAIAGIANAAGSYFAPTTSATSVGFGSHGSSGFLSGARANGGSVGAGRSYLVGERGPEILTMGAQGGYVNSNEKSFGGSGQSMVVNIDARGAQNGVEQDIRRVMGEVSRLRNQVPNIALSAVRDQNKRMNGFLA